MLGDAGTRKLISKKDGIKRKDTHDSSPKRLHSRHSHLQEKVTSIERAMDIAIGDEGNPWDEEEAA
jgi:hypothetical protein